MITYTYKMRPTKSQEAKLWQCLYLTRKMYNDALQELIDHYKATGKYLSRFDHNKLHGKRQHPELHAWIVDEVISRVHQTYANFFGKLKQGKKTGFPRFKSARRWHSFEAAVHGTQKSFTLQQSSFFTCKKLGGKIRVNLSRQPEGLQRMARIIRKNSGWYLLMVTDYEKPKMEPNEKAIGLDFGLTSIIADSEGRLIDNPQFLKQSLKKLRIAHRRQDRRKKGSKRKKKASKILGRMYERVANQRHDFLHKIARKYVNEYGVIVVEDLRIENMVKNRFVSRAILDSNWGMLRDLLEEKAESAGRQVIAVPPHYTSQKCSQCGEIVQKSLSVRTHVCPWCGYVADRDVNAARNILRAGTRPSGANVEVVISSVA